MATIRPTPNGRFQARWRDNTSPNPHGKTFDLRREAKAYGEEQEHAKRAGTYITPDNHRVTVAQWGERWRAVQGWKPNTVARVETTFRLHLYPVLGGYPLGQVRRTDVQGWVRQLEAKLSPSTVKVAVQGLSAMMAAAVKETPPLIPSNPCTGVVVKDASPPRVNPPTLTEVETLAWLLPPKWKALVAVGVGLGLRSGEALGLTVDRIGFLSSTPEVLVDRQGSHQRHTSLKTEGSERTVPLPGTVRDRLSAHLQRYGPGDGGLVFHRDDGSMWQGQQLSATIHRAVVLSAGDLPAGLTFRSLRHFYASFLIASGESVKTVQNRLGHKSATITLDTYGHLWPDNEEATRRAVDVMFEKMLREGTG